MRRQGTPGFNGRRLKQARDVLGITITALAEMVGVSKQAISQFERGQQDGKVLITPRPEVLDRISTCLNYPKEFFLHQGLDLDETPIYYRSLSAATKAGRARAESKFTWLQEITSILKEYVELPHVNIPSFSVNDHTALSNDDIEEFAAETRRYWGLGDGPLSNVVALLENNGVIISRFDLEAETLDALSQWSHHDNTPYIFLSSGKSSAVRSRFDASHELAHLTFHRRLRNNVCYHPVVHSVLEKQAHRFASAFLLPARPFVNDLFSPTLDCFWALKEKWHISIGAMIVRCQHLNIIDDDYTRKLWINYNRRGWARKEPLDDRIPIEEPRLLRRSLELLLNERLMTKHNITHYFPYPSHHLEQLLNLPKDSLRITDDFEYVPNLKATTHSPITEQAQDSKIVQFPRKEK